MTEIKEENCSLNSPCIDGICNIDTNKCSTEKEELTVYIKHKLFTGTQKNVIDKIKKEYSNITKNAKCTMGEHGHTRQKYKDQYYDKLQETNKGKLIAFYSPSDDNIICISRYVLIEYWNKVMNTYAGIIITNKGAKKLAKFGSKYYDFIVQNGKPEYMIPLNDQAPSVFIKQSMINNILTKGHSFFAILRTDKKWLMVPRREEKYNNYIPSKNKYGDNLFLVVPLDQENSKEKKENIKGVEKFKESVVKKYCKITKSLIPNRKIQQLSKKLYLYLSGLKQSKLSENEKIVVDKLTLDLIKVKPSQRLNYPYWYNLNNPMGLKLIKTLRKHNIKLQPNTILSTPNISFEYQEKVISKPNSEEEEKEKDKDKIFSRYTVTPVYINTRINQYLVCQKYDVNYEVNLYVVNSNNKLYFTQHLNKAIAYYHTLPSKPNLNKIPLNMGYPKTIPIEPVYKANKDPDYSVDIYGVVVIFKKDSIDKTYNLYMCGTSLEAMTKEYVSLFGGKNSIEIGKLLVKLDMNVELIDNKFTRNILKKEYYETPMSIRLEYLKNFAEAFRQQYLSSMTELQRDKYNRYINRVLEKQRKREVTPETKEEMKQNIKNIIGHFYNDILKLGKEEKTE